jgi:hypothetical protein
MKITTKNYFSAIKRIGVRKLPEVLKQSHELIKEKTDTGKDWSFYKKDADLKRLMDLAFLKLGEFSIYQSRQDLHGPGKFSNSNLNAKISTPLDAAKALIRFYVLKRFSIVSIKRARPKVEGEEYHASIKSDYINVTQVNGKATNRTFPIKDIYRLLEKEKTVQIPGKRRSLDGREEPKQKRNMETRVSLDNIIDLEVSFIKVFLEFNNKVVSKHTLELFINDLQKAIREQAITKKSPVAKDIMAIQLAALAAYNNKGKAKPFFMKPATVKRLKNIIEKYEDGDEDFDEEYLDDTKDISPLNGLEPAVPHVMNSQDFAKMQFDTIGFKDKWLDFIGDPAPGFTAMVFGMPKMGKSYLCMDFAGYLARNHGRVLYVAKEEKLDATLQKKLNDKNVANENLDVADSLPADLSMYDFIFIDSVNRLGLSPKDLLKLKEGNKHASFIYVFQSTKVGKFRGDNGFQHDVDVVVEVPEKGKAIQFGRFNQGGKMDVFDDNSSDYREGI